MAHFPSTRRRLLVSAGLACTLPRAVLAQSPWPSRPLRIVVPFPPGGLTDNLARAYGEFVARKFGATLIVENKAGAGGTIGVDSVAKAAPDGHTLLVSTSGSLWQSRVLYRKLPFNADKDLVPMALFPSGALVFAVNEKLPIRTPKDYVEAARKGPMNMGTYAPASWPHLIADTWNQTQGVNILAVHYKGETPMWVDVASGQIQGGIGSVQGALPHFQRGAMRAVAMTGPNRSPKMPEVPTLAEQGYDLPIFRMEGWLPMCAPAGTRVEILDKVNEAVREAYTSPKIREMHQFFGIPTGPAHTVPEARRQWNEDAPQWIAAAEKLGIKLD
ncbi:MAG: tripartite tricarboxylate transporter substrate binding protein [Rubrivivax sp.]